MTKEAEESLADQRFDGLWSYAEDPGLRARIGAKQQCQMPLCWGR